MPQDIPQISFGGGIISSSAFSRVDLQKWGSAVKTMDNFFVHAEGGTSNRAGTEYVHVAKDSTETLRLITFEFNEEQAYALEFSDQRLRVYQNGGIVLETAQNITAATQANPVVVTVASHGYSNGDDVYVTGVVGMTELNGKFFTVANVTTNTFELSGIDGTGYMAYSSGGTAAKVFELALPYADSDLATLKFRQSNDVMYLAHRSYAPRKLSRTGAAAWTIEIIDFKPDQTYPTGISVTANTTGTTTYKYKVTAVAEETAEESLVGTGDTATITGATQANPVVITATAHGYSNGDEVHISGIVGMTELNGLRFTIANSTANTFELSGIDGTAYTAYTSGGSADRTHQVITNGAATADNTITFTAVTGAESYNIYKEDNGLWGFIGATETTSFTDDNIAADLEDTAPKWRQPFTDTSSYPGAVGLHEQRSAWGNTTDDPLGTWLSQTSQFENMNVSSPTRATDAIKLRLVTGKGNEIRHFRSFKDRLFIFTSGVLWSLRPGGNDDAITPSSKQLSVEEYLSSTDIPPITIKRNILMVSGKTNEGFEVHSLGYDLQSDAYTGSDLTVLARELFEQHTIKEWAYAERPYRYLACVRDDGKLLMMTYLQEHQVFAWSVWGPANGGLFKSVCSVPEGQDDALYFVIERTINGSTVKYTERLHERDFTNIEDAFFVDCGLTYDGTDPKTITGATQANPVVITSTAHGYANGDRVLLASLGGMTELNNREFTVANVTANTFELNGIDGTGYTAYSSGGTSQLVVQTISGLDHLEGETIIALVDGNLETGLTVSSGSVTLTNYCTKAHLGLSWFGQLDSLPLDTAVQTLAKPKIVKQVTLRVKDTRGLFIGPDADNLEEYPSRSTELWGDPAATLTDLIKIPISDDWGREGGITVQSEPGLPMTILSWVADTDVGGG